VLVDEVTAKALGIGRSLLDRPSAGCVSGLHDGVALIDENLQDRRNLLIGAELHGGRIVAVAVNDESAAVPVFRDVDSEGGSIDRAYFGFRSRKRQSGGSDKNSQNFHLR